MSFLAPPFLYCTQADVETLLGIDAETGRVDDPNQNVIDATAQHYINQAIAYASSKINFYIGALYDFSDLAQSSLVNNYCVVIAAKWLSSRRGNPPPGSINELYKEVIDDLKLIHDGQYQIPEIGQRDVMWPAWSNVRVDMLYNLRKIRVERPLSERSPTTQFQNPQQRDIGADFIIEPN